MTVKVVIAGCRNFSDYPFLRSACDACLSRLVEEGHEICILSGCCRGADQLGERYAEERGYAVELHPANWHFYGSSAGPRRNREMAEAADYVIVFWDGESAGSRSMIEHAKRLGKPIIIIEKR